MEPPNEALAPWRKTRDVLELVTTSTLAFVAVVYVLGLLIVNLRLQRYGIQAFDLLRVHYVMSGSLFLALVTLAGLGGLLAARMLAAARTAWHTRRFGTATMSLAVSVLTPLTLIGGLLLQLSEYGLYLNERRFWEALFATIFAALGSWNLALGGHLTVLGWNVEKDRRLAQLHRTAIDASAFLVSLVVYAFVVYPQIQPAYGGGRSMSAEIVLREDAPARLQRTLTVLAGSKPPNTCSVLADTEDYLVVEDRRRPFHAIAIKKDMLAAVVTNGGQ